MPFLTADTRQVVGIISLSLAAGLSVNAVDLAYDPPWFTGLGDLVTAGIGLAALVRIWQVFPFDFHAYAVDWATPARIVLLVAIVGAGVGTLAHLIRLARRRLDLPALSRPDWPSSSRFRRRPS